MGNGLFGNFGRKMNTSLANMDPTTLSIAARLIANSAPSPRRKSPFEGLDEAFYRGQQMQRQNEAYKRQQDEYARQDSLRTAIAAANKLKGTMVSQPQPNPNFQPQVEGGQPLTSLMQPRTRLEQSLINTPASQMRPFDYRGAMESALSQHGSPDAALSYALREPKKREIRNDQNGVPRYVDTGERAFEGVEPEAAELTESQRTKNAAIDEGRFYMDRHWETHSPDDTEFRLDSQRDDNFSNMARLARTRKYGDDPGHRKYLSKLDPAIYDPEQYQESLVEYQLGLGERERAEGVKFLAGDLLRNLNPDDLARAGAGLESFGVSRKEFKAALKALDTPEETIDFIMDRI